MDNGPITKYDRQVLAYEDAERRITLFEEKGELLTFVEELKLAAARVEWRNLARKLGDMERPARVAHGPRELRCSGDAVLVKAAPAPMPMPMSA